jgi:hypothetical protein
MGNFLMPDAQVNRFCFIQEWETDDQAWTFRPNALPEPEDYPTFIFWNAQERIFN